MYEAIGIIDLLTTASSLLAEFEQVTLVEEQVREPAIRGFIIVGCFVVLPVVIAWFMQRCSDAYEMRQTEGLFPAKE